MFTEFSYSEKSINDILKELNVSQDGLSEKEAQIRLLHYGSNEIKEGKLSALNIFWRQFKSPFIYILLGAALISLFLKEFIDTVMIFVFLAVNGFLGFYQEYKSEKLIQKLKLLIRANAKVRRNGKIEIIEKSKIVKGDVVIIEKGDVVPADIRIVKSQNLIMNESILTGESKSVFKNVDVLSGVKNIFEAQNMAFMGTTVVSGSAEGLVVATGKDTQIGKVSEIVSHIERKSGFENMVLNFSKFVLNLVLATLAILFVANLVLKGFDINISQTLLFTLALAISVVPEALPVITTVTLSRGALKLAKEHVVVKRLSSLEDLGNIEVLCSDKTGTITKNELELKEWISWDKDKCFLFGAVLPSGYDKKTLKENEFEFAVWQKLNEDNRSALTNYKILWHEPFDPEKRIAATVFFDHIQKKNYLVLKGAPEEVFERSKFISINDNNEKIEKYKNELRDKFKEFGKSGFRVLAVAVKEVSDKEDYCDDLADDFSVLGILGFYDPLKPTAKDAIALAKKLNVEVKIITGDSLEVAEFIAGEAGILSHGEKGILGSSLESLTGEDFTRAVLGFKVFARISPEQKFKIIQEIQKYKPAGFLGEGINDAPALKLANVAIVVDSGADVAKEAADVIMLRKDLKVIVDGISEGRRIYTNIIKYIKYTLTGNFGNFYAIAGISLITPYLPMLPSQILLTNLLSDLPLMSVASDNVDHGELKKPSHHNIKDIALISVILGLVSSLADFAFFGMFFRFGEQNVQTMWFIESILAEIILIFSIRTRLPLLKSRRPSKLLIVSCIAAAVITVFLPFTLIGQKLFHFSRPTVEFMLMIAGLLAVYFVLTEAVKVWYYKFYISHNNSSLNK